MLAGIVTIVSLLAFLGGVLWAYSGKRRREFEEAARIPLAEDDPVVDNDAIDGADAAMEARMRGDGR